MATPRILFFVKEMPNNKLPIVSANNGVVEFMMPDNALSIFVPATQNIIEGMRLPNKPNKGTNTNFSLGSDNDFKLIIINGIKAKKAMLMRNAATSSGEKTLNPFLIKKNEKPQIVDNPANISQS